MNYGEIKTAITNRSHRTDLASHIPEFVALAESEYNQRTTSSYDLTSGTDSTHNWLSDNASQVYIFGGLKELALWTGDDASLQKDTALFERAIRDAQYAEVVESGVVDETLATDVPTSTTFDIFEG